MRASAWRMWLVPVLQPTHGAGWAASSRQARSQQLLLVPTQTTEARMEANGLKRCLYSQAVMGWTERSKEQTLVTSTEAHSSSSVCDGHHHGDRPPETKHSLDQTPCSSAAA